MISPVRDVQLARHKAFLRGFYRAKVLALPSAARRRLSEAAVRRLAALPVFKDAQTVGVYVSMEGEVDTASLIRLCQRLGKVVALPVVFPDGFRLEFSLLSQPLKWKKNVYGIPELDKPRLLDPRNIELLVVPGRAFTPEGGRLGVGVGYYDRFLARHPRMLAVALAFDEQVVPRLPTGSFDRAVGLVVTPTRVLKGKHA